MPVKNPSIPKFTMVKIEKIKYDHNYQRGVCEAQVNEIAKNFCWHAFGVVSLGRRANGDLMNVNGQQRTHGAAKKGYTAVPSLIVESSGPRFEAQLYRKLNTMRNLTSLNKFLAGVKGGLEPETTIDRLVAAAGLSVPRSPRKEWPYVQAVSQLGTIYKKGGDHLTHVLRFISCTWGGNVAALGSQILAGTSLFLLDAAETQSFDEKRAIRLLSKRDPTDIARQFSDKRSSVFGKAAQAIQYGMICLYNHKLAPGKKLPLPS